MSNQDFSNASENHLLEQPGTSVTKAPKPFEKLRVPRLVPEFQRLYGWMGLLTGLSFVSIFLLAGLAFWLKLQQDRLEQQLSTKNAYEIQTQRINNLESRINSLDTQTKLIIQDMGLLNQQVSKGLPTQIKGVQKDISSVKTSIQKVQANVITREQMTHTLKQIQRAKR